MAINNPYVPGDPFSYDLKWLVRKIKEHQIILDGLDERIQNAIIAALEDLDQLGPKYFESAADLIGSDLKDKSIAYIEGFYAPSDGGANLYYVTTDYNDIIGADFYLTLDGPNRWALPIIVTPYVMPEMFGAKGDGIEDDTTAIQTAIDFENGKRPVVFGPKAFAFTRLVLQPSSVLQGSGTRETALVCVDASTTDANVAFGSALRKADDGVRGVSIQISDMYISTGEPFTGSHESEYQNVIGLNLCACERSIISNVGVSGFGYAGIVLARAEGGAEGLGFTGTTQDGNYNDLEDLRLNGCGTYGTGNAAVWLAYKSNSNFLKNVNVKGNTVGAFTINGNGNTVIGCNVESSDFVASVNGNANSIIQPRAENIGSDAVTYASGTEYNVLMGGHFTSVTGSEVVDNGYNVVVSHDDISFRLNDFPNIANLSTKHNNGMAKFSSVRGDATHPLYVKSDGYNTDEVTPSMTFYSTIIAGATGNEIGAINFHNSDSSGGAAGDGASIKAILEGSGGQTGIAFFTGTGTTATEKFRVYNSGALINTPPSSAPTLANGQLTVHAVNNTTLRITYKGSDGTSRHVDLTLA